MWSSHNSENRMIICSAIRVGDLVICGLRHHNCYEILNRLDPIRSMEARQCPDAIVEGFITHEGKFLDRYEAYRYAKFCGQISATTQEKKDEEHTSATLYSEDLY